MVRNEYPHDINPLYPSTLLKFCKWLEYGKRFTFVRFGDGEWDCILHGKGSNCDGVKYSKQLQSGLIRVLSEHKFYQVYENYHLGLLEIARRSQGKDIKAFLAKKKIDVEFMDGTFLVSCNRRGLLFPLIEVLRKNRVIYVGPPHLRGLATFKVCKLIETHPTDAFKHINTYLERVMDIYRDGDVIGFSAGLAAKVLINDLYKFIGHKVTLLDFGSLWDPYVGINSRLYMQRENWQEEMQSNLHGDIWSKEEYKRLHERDALS